MRERKADPFEARARGLALCTPDAEPDHRVPMPGNDKRTVPLWTLFRDEAKRQIQAEKLASAPPVLGPMWQSGIFVNSPLTVFGEHEQNTLDQMATCMKVGNVAAGVICADGHLGYAQPVGGVIAYHKQVSISGVGFDIGCGNMAVRLDIPFHAVQPRIQEILGDMRRALSFGVGQTNNARVEHALFDDANAWRAADMEFFRAKAMAQLGTIGSGNHYVDLFVETTHLDDPEFGGTIEDCPVWIGVHFGSRGLGHTAATKYLKAAGGKDGINVPPAVVNEGDEIGIRYLAAMELAGRYAYAGREWVVERVRQMIGGHVQDIIHNHHNYAWKEIHSGEEYWVVRKGATPAFPGQRGFIGGSMGDDAVIIEGVESYESQTALYSTIHGAGRAGFGRKEAKRRFTREQMDAWLQEKGVSLIGGDLDESPMAYRRLPEVLAHHEGTIKVLHTLRPFAVAMAGVGEYDPWKD